MNKFRVDNILKITEIKNELELEQARSLFNKLRVLVKDPSVKALRQHLVSLIEVYENEFWSNEEKVSNEQWAESEQAEKTVRFQDQFIQERKRLIRKALKERGLNQNDLAEILAHRKNYMSELINGARPFSQEDILIIYKFLGLRLDQLIVPVIKEKTITRIRSIIEKMGRNRPELKGEGFGFELG